MDRPMMDRDGAATAFGGLGRLMPLHSMELNQQLAAAASSSPNCCSPSAALNSRHRQPGLCQHQHQQAAFSPTASTASTSQHGVVCDALSASSDLSSPSALAHEQACQARLTQALGQHSDHFKLLPQNHQEPAATDALYQPRCHQPLDRLDVHAQDVARLADPSATGTSQLVHSKSLASRHFLHQQARQQLQSDGPHFEASNFHGLSRPAAAPPPPHAYQSRLNSKLNSNLNSNLHSATAAATLAPHNHLLFPTSTSSASPLTAPFQSSVYRCVTLPTPHQNLYYQLHHPANSGASAPLSAHHRQDLSMAAPFDPQSDELARMQELSNNWEPEPEGPLVSERLPSSSLTQEYANADPAYRVKTKSLPQKYTQYRTCRGDGHCGWRAIAFGYFEALLRIGDKQKFLFEEARLKSLQNMLKDIGLSEGIYEDFVDDTIDLLREISTTDDDGATLLQAFNDFSRAQSVITFLKLLTSASMQKNPAQWQPFIEIPVVDYCTNNIDPAVAEIEHVGLAALAELLTKPAGIAVQVFYLDRSPGEKVDQYDLEPIDQNGRAIPDPPTIRLLYRPGHYDILYEHKDLPIRAPVQDIVVEINQTPARYGDKLPFPVNNFADIPGLDFFPGSSAAGSHSGWGSVIDQFEYTPHSLPVSSHVQSIAVSAPHYQSLQAPPNSIHDIYGQAPMTMSSHQPSTPISPVSTIPSAISAYGGSMDTREPFRPSKYTVEPEYPPMCPGPSFYQTSQFKNSHFNTAHFNNPEFAPEQWDPQHEYGNERRKKSSGH